MKKFLSLILVLILCLGVFVACGDDTPSVDTNADVGKATDYVKTMYKKYLSTADELPETADDFELVSKVLIGGVTYTVTWTSNNDAAKVTEAGDGKVVIDIVDNAKEAIDYELTAVVSAADGTKGDPLVFKLRVPATNLVTIPEALEAADGTFVTVQGKVTLINTPWDDGYKNITVTIEDADGNKLYIYRLGTNVKLGDLVTIKGVMATYNGARQIAQGATATITGHEDVTLTYKPVTIPEALKEADNTLVEVTGTVMTIDGAWSDQYKNMSVTIVDKDGNKLYIYRLGTKVEVGDILKIQGVMATYNDARQIAQGATAEITGHEDIVVDYTEMSIPDAKNAADDTLVIVKGTVKTIDTEWSDSYGNISVTIVDAEGNELYLYRLSTKVEVGDILTVKGKVGSYEGAKQIAQGATATITGKDENMGGGTDNTTPPDTTPVGPTVEMPELVEKPVVGTPYKFAINNVTVGKVAYFNGALNSQGYYFGTTEDITKAVDVYYEAVEGGYRLYFLKDDVKNYLEIFRSGTYTNAKIVTEPTLVWSYNAEYNLFTAVLEEVTYYIGNYNNGTDAIRPSDFDKYIVEKGEEYWKTQYPARFYEMIDKGPAPEPTINDNPNTGLTYYLQMTHTGKNKVLYVTGDVNGRAVITTTDESKGAILMIEKAGNGYKFYFTKEGEKQYLELYFIDDQSALRFSTTGTIFEYDPFLGAWIGSVNGTEYFLGATGVYTDLYACNAIFLEDKNTKGSQYPVTLLPTGVNLNTIPNSDVRPIAFERPSEFSHNYVALVYHIRDNSEEALHNVLREAIAAKYVYAIVTIEGKDYIISDYANGDVWFRLVIETAGAYVVEGFEYTCSIRFVDITGKVVAYTEEFTQYSQETTSSDTTPNASVALPDNAEKLTVDLTTIKSENINTWGDNQDVTEFFDGDTTGSKIGGGTTDKGTTTVYFALTEAATVKYYTLWTGGDSAQWRGRNPRSWKLYGKVGEEWVVLDEVNPAKDCAPILEVNSTAFTYAVDNIQKCTEYKIEFVTRGALQLNELELFNAPDVLSFADKANRTVLTDDQQVWQSGAIKLINDKAENTNNIADYANPARFYAKTSVTVEYKNMGKLVFECGSNSYANVLATSIGNGATASGKIVTVVLTEAVDTLTWTMTAQSRVKSLTVYPGEEAPEAPSIPELVKDEGELAKVLWEEIQ